jgi:hypothetical protein
VIDLHALFQSAIQPVQSITGMIQSGAAIVIVGLQGWIVNTVRQTRDEVKALRQHMFGLNGDNGMNGDLKAVQRHMTVHDEQLATHDKRLTVLEFEREQREGRCDFKH